MPPKNRRSARFWGLWSATGVTAVGDGMVLVAFPLLALHFTKSSIAIAGVAVAARLPGVLVALPAGAIADRMSRRRVLVGLEVLRFAVMAAFGVSVLVRADGLPTIYTVVFLLGGLTVAFDVAASASVPSVVGPDRLVGANARLLTAEMTGEELVGQAIGGAAYSLGRHVPFVGNAASSALSAALLYRAIPDQVPSPSGDSVWSDLVSGLKWFLHHPLMRTLVAAVAGLAFCQVLVLGVLALYATTLLHLTSTAYGLFLAVASIGNIVGAVFARPLYRRVGGGWCIVGAAVIAAAAYPVLGITHNALVAAACLAVECGAVIVGNVAVRTLRQTAVPDEMQGRAASAFSMLIQGVLPVGALAGGVLADSFGLRTTYVVAGIMQAVFVASVVRRLLGLTRRGAAPPGGAAGPEGPRTLTGSGTLPDA